MTFERIAIGDGLDLGAHTFTAEEIRRFAAAYDPQPFHLDEAAAEAGLFGRLSASGWHTASVMMRLLVDALKREADAAAARGEPPATTGPSPGFDDLRWLKPVLAGDTIAFATRITAKRLSASRPGWGIVSMATTGANQDGVPVFSVTTHVFVKTLASSPRPLVS